MSRRRSSYCAHPAFVLRPVADPSGRVSDEALGYAWLKLSREERERRERVFFSELLARLSVEPDATVEASFEDLHAAEAFAARWQLVRDGYDVSGTCSSDLAQALVGEALDRARIENPDDGPLFAFESGRNSVETWVSDRDWWQWYLELQAAIQPDPHAPAATEHPVRASLFIVLSYATYLVGSLIAVGAMRLLHHWGLPLPAAIAIGFVLLVPLTLGPVSRVKRRIDRLV
ncbi:hypothetical protein Q5424_16155 [Conexibacter sp. JD483]|uniref:hypothetical protein n=1 Tax=unclassified Conexibacter TaxID=2627773 RepID=UPI00271DA8AF|nr:MULTISPECIES: hypothetical protein [unclassified Conexibacter]MDO8187283.1 hypothetical protein [Conexibacter sp. CPCC 205706]MDO8198892.1 hypothetical protein [Conexibacter sp. CPCC 205762]MDR9370631.1 hypothetical protein [Conexibacter sp. JD483]